MQLGTRWAVGGQPPAGLPHAVEVAIRSVEEELDATVLDAATLRWTLTWLEGKPVVELDDGTVIRYNRHEDSATISQVDDDLDDEDDDYL